GSKLPGLVDPHALANAIEEFDSLQDFLLCLVAETLQLGDAPLCTSLPELGNIVDLELVIQCFDFLRAHARQTEHFKETGRRGLAEVIVERLGCILYER